MWRVEMYSPIAFFILLLNGGIGQLHALAALYIQGLGRSLENRNFFFTEHLLQTLK